MCCNLTLICLLVHSQGRDVLQIIFKPQYLETWRYIYCTINPRISSRGCFFLFKMSYFEKIKYATVMQWKHDVLEIKNFCQNMKIVQWINKSYISIQCFFLGKIFSCKLCASENTFFQNFKTFTIVHGQIQIIRCK